VNFQKHEILACRKSKTHDDPAWVFGEPREGCAIRRHSGGAEAERLGDLVFGGVALELADALAAQAELRGDLVEFAGFAAVEPVAANDGCVLLWC